MPTFSPIVTAEFIDAAEAAIAYVRNSDDPQVAYAAANVPIFIMPFPNSAQAHAGGCPSCTYLGLWANKWEGYAPSTHGIIWLYEDGIRSKAHGDLINQTIKTLEHEIDHALQRDHVLAAMRSKGLLGEAPTGASPCACEPDY